MKSFIPISAIFFIILTGCMSEQSVAKKHYVIDWPESAALIPVDSLYQIKGNCEIETVRIPSLYERNQIINRSDSHELTFYQYHQWAVRPSVSILELLTQYMEQKNLFQNISTRYSRIIPDYRLTAEVLNLEVVEKNKKQFSAHVHLVLGLVNNENEEQILRHEADRLIPMTEKDLNLFAMVVSNTFINELETFSELLTQMQVDPNGRIQ